MENEKMDPRDREYEIILEKEVDQQYRMEELVRDFAIAVRDTIIFLWDEMVSCVTY